MSRNPERRLLERLARVEALHEGATTPGEREAAARALKKVLERLVEVRAKDEVARFCAAHVASLGIPDRPPPDTDEPLPCALDLRRRLTWWHHGHIPASHLRDWASRVCDRTVLPSDPSDPEAPAAEVVLQLAALRRARLKRQDVPAILEFLDSADWGAWFALLERAARRG